MTKCSVCGELAGDDTYIEVGIDARHIENAGKVLRLKLCVACQSKGIDHMLQVCFGCGKIMWLHAGVEESSTRIRYVLKLHCEGCSGNMVAGMLNYVAGPYMG